MKIKKFNDSNILEISYKLYISQIKNVKPFEIHEYKTTDDAITDYLEFINTGFNLNFAKSNKVSSPFEGLPKIYDAYLVKVIKEKIGNEEFQNMLNSKKYNI